MLASMVGGLEQARLALEAARAEGLTFEAAWRHAVAVAGRDWRDTLSATRDAWQAAYELRPAHRRLRALHAVAVDPDREPLPGLDGRCAWCDHPIPADRKATARYCSHACQRAANGRPVAA